LILIIYSTFKKEGIYLYFTKRALTMRELILGLTICFKRMEPFSTNVPS